VTGPTSVPGSWLPSCRTYLADPVNVAIVMTDPSAARTREDTTRTGPAGPAASRACTIALSATGCAPHPAAVTTAQTRTPYWMPRRHQLTFTGP
jgi:hypothetical protein